MKELNQYHINYYINQLENKNLEFENLMKEIEKNT